MAEQTGIEWTDSTWNIVTGCTRVGPGCANCYIERTPPFRMNGRVFARVGNEETTGVTLHRDRLKKVPRGPKVFTPSLSDLFHEEIPFDFIADVYRVMSACWHARDGRIFQILTKRPERAREFYEWIWERGSLWPESQREEKLTLPNVWLGVSIENARYTYRADILREIPAAVRFISGEPLLGSLFSVRREQDAAPAVDEPPLEAVLDAHPPRRALATDADVAHAASVHRRAVLDLTGIDWVIVGGESGPKARPMLLDWARELVDACREHGVAPFVKQLGAKPRDNQPNPRGLAEYDLMLRDRKGGDISEWPPDIRIREFPATAAVPA